MKLKLSVVTLLSIFTIASYAEETIVVTGSHLTQQKSVGSEKVTHHTIDRQMIHNSRELVRYKTGISAVEGDRGGTNGFAIRGVDVDRVGITVDGLAQGESRSSTGFQELFARYGNFNTSRNDTEFENISSVNIEKGADSIESGSGALGGVVRFHTKSPSDYLKPNKPFYIGIKGTYTSKNKGFLESITAAARYHQIDGIVVLTKHKHHETKSYSKNNHITYVSELETDTPKAPMYGGKFRSIPDPQNANTYSSLIKLGWHINDDNYLQLIYDDRRNLTITNELSNLWKAGTYLYDEDEVKDSILRYDLSFRQHYGMKYENSRFEGPYDLLTARLDHQKITSRTLTWEVPTAAKIAESGRKIDTYYKNRAFYQTTNKLTLKFDKSIYFTDPNYMDLKYGLGLRTYRNDSTSHNVLIYLFNPDRPASKQATNTNFIAAKTKSLYAFVKDTIYLKNKYRINLGLRYDYSHSKALPDPLFNKKMAVDGVLNARSAEQALTYSVGFDWLLSKNLTLLSKISTGFRVPTVDEMWFNFPHPQFTVRANPQLKPEHATNYELGLDYRDHWGFARLSAYQTNYHDFIEFAELGFKPVMTWDESTGEYNISPAFFATTYQNRNLATARVRGIEFEGRYNSQILLPGAYITFNTSYSKGTMGKDRIPMNAIQPWKAVIGLGYDHHQQWGIEAHITHVEGKKAKDTTAGVDGSLKKPFHFVPASKAYNVTDVTGYWKWKKYVTIRGGVYNLFNEHYLTWNAIRHVRQYGVSGVVEKNPPYQGIERFSAPSRNYNVSVQIEY